MRLYSILLVAFAMVFAFGCKEDHGPDIIDWSMDTFPDRVPEWTDRFIEEECGNEVYARASAQCGVLFVPEDHGNPDGPEIALPVVRYFSNDEDVAADPIVYLEGGPGASGVESVALFHIPYAPYIGARDLVVFDQRGTGFGEPSLACAEVIGQEGVEDEMTFLSACYDFLVGEEIALAHYNTTQSAADVEALRLALGYDTWNLWGISYGTRLAQAVMRDYPDGIRSAILDSNVPLEVNLYEGLAARVHGAFEVLFAACDMQPGCADQYPDLMSVLVTTMGAMDENPHTAQLTSGEVLSLDGDLLLEALFLIMYSDEALPYIPLLVYQAAGGDYSTLELIADEMSAYYGGISTGMHYSVNCAEQGANADLATFETLSQGIEPRFVSHFHLQEIIDACDIWDVPAAPPSESAPLSSDIPSLVMAGTFDPITPPELSEMLHGNLSNSRYLLFPGGSHGTSVSPCGVEAALLFLDNPTDAASPPCLEGLSAPVFSAVYSDVPGLSFVLPGEGTIPAEVIERAVHHAKRGYPGTPIR